MSRFPHSPPVRRGALITMSLGPGGPSVVPFQYNPATLSRRLEPRAGGEHQANSGRVAQAPEETIRLTVQLNAVDPTRPGGLPKHGLQTQLAALEVLVYPSSLRVAANTVLAAVGVLEVLPPPERLTLFVWGPARVLPVRVTELSVEETRFDPDLNPIQAEVSLGLRVLSYEDLDLRHPGYAAFFAHQVVKEQLARANTQEWR